MKIINSKYLSIIGSLLIITFAVVLAVISKPIHFVDDSWISFRYATNLANHGELTFNLGERVEGVSNLLWTLILTLQSYVFSLSVPVVVAYSTVILIIYSLYRIWKLGVLLELHPLLATIPPLFLVLSSDFWGAATNGLEIPLFSALLLDTIYNYTRKKYSLASVFLGLLFLVRFETIGIGILFISFLFLEISKSSKKQELFRSIAIYFCFILTTTIFRLLYYKDIIPNSVRAKLTDSELWIFLSGIRYIIEFIGQDPLFFILLAVSLFLLLSEVFKQPFLETRDRIFLNPSNRLLVVSVVWILFSLVVVTKNGGDWMPHYRLLFLYGTLYACIFIILLKKGTLNLFLSLAILLGPLIQVSDAALHRIRYDQDFLLVDYTPDMEFWGESVERLSPVLSPSDIVSAEAIGYIGYCLPNTYVHDPLGLTNSYIANNGRPAIPYGKTDVQYTVNIVHPSVMIWHYTGHLKDLDANLLDEDYKTYCYSDCDSWSADVVMIRFDRVNDLSINFGDWTEITIKSLSGEN